MLRKVFLKNEVVVAIGECGSVHSNVTCSISDSSVFVEDDRVVVEIGYNHSVIEGKHVFTANV